jgi:hypothetical protein
VRSACRSASAATTAPAAAANHSQLLQKSFQQVVRFHTGGGTAVTANCSKLLQQQNQQATNTLPALSLRSPFHLLARHPQANIRLPWQAAKI